MATLVLASVGTSIGAGIGGAGSIFATAGGIVGGFFGSLVDLSLLGALTKQPRVIGPRLEDLRTISAEGAPIPWLLGPENRVGANIIWMGPVEEVAETTTHGKKKIFGITVSRGTSVTEFKYFVSLAGLLSDTEIVGPIKDIQRIWANGKLIFSRAEDIEIISDQLSVETLGFAVPFGGPSIITGYRIISPVGGPNLTQFVSGLTVQISGFANAGNNGSRTVHSVGTLGTGATFVRVALENDVESGAAGAPANESAGATATLLQDLPDISAGLMDDLRVYNGSLSQQPDPLIESIEGVGKVPAYRGDSYIVLERLALNEFQRQVPQFNILVEAQSSKLVGDAVGNIIQRVGLAADQFNVDQVVVHELRGMNINGVNPVGQVLQPIMIYHNLDLVERAGTMVFYHRGQEEVFEIDADHLAARQSDGGAVKRLQLSDVSGLDLPDSVNVTYIESKNDWQTGAQQARRINALMHAPVDLNIPFVVSAQRARELAERLLWTYHIERRGGELSLPPSYMGLEEGDVVLVPEPGEQFRLRISRLSRGKNGLFELSAVTESSQAKEFNLPADDPVDPDQQLYIPPLVEMAVVNGPALDLESLADPGFHYAAAAAVQGTEWKGATLFISQDGEEFEEFVDIPAQSFVGLADTTLLDTGPHGYWDLGSELTVVMLHGTLSSRTDQQVYSGANRFLVGREGRWELIGAANAELIAPHVYKLTKLLRGLRGTQWAQPLHDGEDLVVDVSELFIQFAQIDPGIIGSTRFFKPVAFAGNPEIAPVTESMLVAENLKPFSPVHIAGVRDGANDLTISWFRRTRALTILFPGQLGQPLAEASEAYEVDIVVGGSVVRTIESSTTEATYTAAEQSADGITPGNPVTVRIYQLSNVVGRGRGREAVV